MNAKDSANTSSLLTLCATATGTSPDTWTLQPIAGEGSNRRYYRLMPCDIARKPLIGVIGENKEENAAFIYLSRHFSAMELNVPAVMAVSPDGMMYIEQDLGDNSLFKEIKNSIACGVFGDKEMRLLCKTIKALPRLQMEGAHGLDFDKCYPLPAFDKQSIMWDLNYFKYCFLKLQPVDVSEPLLESDFNTLCSNLLSLPCDAFMYRDFQSRNVMIKDNEPFFIDFQGGRKGPALYDLASFVWQAKANYPSEVKETLIGTYYNEMEKYSHTPREEFNRQLSLLVLFRTLQVLGAYGFRGLVEKKRHFVESIPFALNNLKELCHKGILAPYPHLESIALQLAGVANATATEKKALTVTVSSFSFKRGIPYDQSGNGGGYVFDCRAVNNPAKYEQYKSLTGLDQSVIDFLEQDGEITAFLQHVYALVDAHVERYMQRGFTHLSINFGCTGGQHRSVYSAQHTGMHIWEKYGIKVEIVHHEQKKRTTLESK